MNNSSDSDKRDEDTNFHPFSLIFTKGDVCAGVRMTACRRQCALHRDCRKIGKFKNGARGELQRNYFTFLKTARHASEALMAAVIRGYKLELQAEMILGV